MSEPPKPSAAAPAAPPAKPAAPPPPAPLGAEKDAALLWARIRKRPVPLLGVAFTVPVFVIFHLSILLLERAQLDDLRRSGFDLVATWFIGVLETSKPVYVFLPLALALALLVRTWVLQKRGKIAESPHKRVLGEAAGTAVLGLLLGFIARRTLPGLTSTATVLPWIDRVVLALGSGFYSEAVFRALLIAGGGWLLIKLMKMKKRPWVALVICSVLASLFAGFAQAFSVFAEQFPWGIAAYGTVEAMFFAALFVTRGFAVAVYAHTFYNLVGLLLPN